MLYYNVVVKLSLYIETYRNTQQQELYYYLGSILHCVKMFQYYTVFATLRELLLLVVVVVIIIITLLVRRVKITTLFVFQHIFTTLYRITRWTQMCLLNLFCAVFNKFPLGIHNKYIPAHKHCICLYPHLVVFATFLLPIL